MTRLKLLAHKSTTGFMTTTSTTSTSGSGSGTSSSSIKSPTVQGQAEENKDTGVTDHDNHNNGGADSSLNNHTNDGEKDKENKTEAVTTSLPNGSSSSNNANTNTNNNNSNNNNNNHSNHNNTTNPGIPVYPSTWPASARQRGAELEGQLRQAPDLDSVRAAMIVGFAQQHSNGLRYRERQAFCTSLLHVLWQRQHFVVATSPSSSLPHGYNATAHTAQMTLAHINQQVRQWEQEQEMRRMMQWQQQKRQQEQLRLQRQQQQKQRQRQALQQQLKPQRIYEKLEMEEYNGPAKPIEGIDLTGWTQKTVRRRIIDKDHCSSGRKRSRSDNYWYTPQTKTILRSRPEILRFLQYYHDSNDECYQDEKKAADKAKREGKRKYEQRHSSCTVEVNTASPPAKKHTTNHDTPTPQGNQAKTPPPPTALTEAATSATTAPAAETVAAETVAAETTTTTTMNGHTPLNHAGKATETTPTAQPILNQGITYTGYMVV